MRRRQQGFTLLEVLIAGVILFAVISVATIVYRSALLTSDKAERSLMVNGMVPILVDAVQYQIQQQGAYTENLQGQGQMDQVHYSWNAKQLDFQAAPPKVIPEAGMVQEQMKRFKLWQVTLNAQYHQYQRELRYVEFSWEQK